MRITIKIFFFIKNTNYKKKRKEWEKSRARPWG